MDYPGKVITKNQVTPTQTSATGVWTLDDAAAAVRNNNWPVAGVPNPISKSLRFNSADSANLTRTPSVNGNRKTWTWSAWVKRSLITQAGTIWGSNFSSGGFGLAFGNYGGAGVAAEYIGITLYAVGTVTTNAVFRDPSSWYHIVARFDSTQAAQADRFRLYVNGVQQTLSANLNVTQNADYHINESGRLHVIGGESGYFNNFYMTEIHHVDGQSLTPSSFGMTDPQTGVWEPIRYTGTYGTNGFYLNFKDATSTTTLGYDYSGNSNNWTTNNFSVTAGSGNDSLTDVPTPWIAYNTTGDVGGVVRGNYCNFITTASRMNVGSITNGGLDVATNGGSSQKRASFGLTSGKWYWEITITGGANAASGAIGIAESSAKVDDNVFTTSGFIMYFGTDGNKYVNGTGSGYGASYTTNDVIGVALDLDSGTKTITFYKNNSSQGSITISGITTAMPFLANGSSTQDTTYSANFGQRPFAYTPPAGFLSLCTTNLPTPTIGATTATQANKYFDATTYTGTGAVLTVTNSGGFQPDFVWVKSRSAATDNVLGNTQTTNGNILISNSTAAEAFSPGLYDIGYVGGVNGFKVQNFDGRTDTNTATYVAWQWRASNAAGVTNTAGTITSTVSANTTAGFSIVTYTGTGANATVGHGLGVAPSMVIVKCRNASATEFIVYNKNAATSLSETYYLTLDGTFAASNGVNFWNNTAPTSSVFSVSTQAKVNGNTNTFVAYCFAAVAGYSAFGSYTGNGSSDGPFVYTGFRPRYVLLKSSSASASWYVHDTARDPYNVTTNSLYPNLSAAEDQGFLNLDILSNGFKLRTTTSNNANGTTYIYAAFAESPFKFALAR